MTRYEPADSFETPRFSGVRTFMRLPNVQDLKNADAAIVGAPFDTGGTFRVGARFGPESIRSVLHLLRRYNPGLGVMIFEHTILANDVYAGFVARGDHNRVLVSRVTTLLVGVIVLVISLIVSDVVGALTVAYDLLSGALFVPIVGALFWRRATAAGALASMAAGSVVVVIFMVLDGLFANTPIIYGMLASLVLFVVVSLLTPRPSGERMRAWENRLGGSGSAP